MAEFLFALYLGIHLVSAGLACALGYWSVRRTEMRSKRWFGALMAGLAGWSLVAAAELVVPGQSSQTVIKVLYLSGGLTMPLLWVLFTADYTHRSVRRNPIVRVVATAYVLLVVTALTNPVHSLYASFVFHETPFVHTELLTGPARIPGIAYTLSGMALGTYYLGSLFARGRSQVSKPPAILAGVVLLGSVPFLGSVLGMMPVATYDHTPFGVSVFLLGVGYVVLRYSFYNLSPVARDIVIDEIDDGMFVLDHRARLVDFNTAAADVVPGLEAAAIGTALTELHTELAELLSDDGADHEDEIVFTVDGELRYFSVKLSDISAGTDRIGTVVILQDITDRRTREQRLKRQNERLDQFASMVSHDLRNPLNVAKLRTEMVLRERESDNAEAVGDALARMETMIEDMLRLARAGEDIDTTEECLLDDVVTEAWENVSTGDSELVSRVGDATLEADTTRLTQLFENLFRNALDHNEQAPTVRVGVLESDSGLYVEDDGAGIPEAQRSAVFGNGYTTDSKGSGLGLAIVSDIVDGHGWTIQVTESHDGGARFEIRTDHQREDIDPVRPTAQN